MIAKAICSCKAESEDEISFIKDQLVVNIEKSSEDGWFYGTVEDSGQRGLFPENYVQFIEDSTNDKKNVVQPLKNLAKGATELNKSTFEAMKNELLYPQKPSSGALEQKNDIKTSSAETSFLTKAVRTFEPADFEPRVMFNGANKLEVDLSATVEPKVSKAEIDFKSAFPSVTNKISNSTVSTITPFDTNSISLDSSQKIIETQPIIPGRAKPVPNRSTKPAINSIPFCSPANSSNNVNTKNGTEPNMTETTNNKPKPNPKPQNLDVSKPTPINSLNALKGLNLESGPKELNKPPVNPATKPKNILNSSLNTPATQPFKAETNVQNNIKKVVSSNIKDKPSVNYKAKPTAVILPNNTAKQSHETLVKSIHGREFDFKGAQSNFNEFDKIAQNFEKSEQVYFKKSEEEADKTNTNIGNINRIIRPEIVVKPESLANNNADRTLAFLQQGGLKSKQMAQTRTQDAEKSPVLHSSISSPIRGEHIAVSKPARLEPSIVEIKHSVGFKAGPKNGYKGAENTDKVVNLGFSGNQLDMFSSRVLENGGANIPLSQKTAENGSNSGIVNREKPRIKENTPKLPPPLPSRLSLPNTMEKMNANISLRSSSFMAAGSFSHNQSYGQIDSKNSTKFPLLSANKCRLYSHLFRKNDKKKRQSLEKGVVMAILDKPSLQTKDGRADLSHIWTLADRDKDGVLSLPEFILAMWLADFYIDQEFLPDTLVFDDIQTAYQYKETK
ncbi:hypothetical protein BB561_004727 [Smittium simulii]|uniref:SH3 domain-containing protein n=1 Tax=Smittium simulii TaxID=133385 RepID=A0A2T9YEN9_9FUNG|nr:hypothetical protein BB561_004727 [Smittium simulii]